MNDLLLPGAFLAPYVIEDAVTRALGEDLGRAGDITSAATVPPETKALGAIEARKPGVIAGLACAAEAFRRLDPALTFRAHVRDGAAVANFLCWLDREAPAGKAGARDRR